MFKIHLHNSFHSSLIFFPSNELAFSQNTGKASLTLSICARFSVCLNQTTTTLPKLKWRPFQTVGNGKNPHKHRFLRSHYIEYISLSLIHSSGGFLRSRKRLGSAKYRHCAPAILEARYMIIIVISGPPLAGFGAPLISLFLPISLSLSL